MGASGPWLHANGEAAGGNEGGEKIYRAKSTFRHTIPETLI